MRSIVVEVSLLFPHPFPHFYFIDAAEREEKKGSCYGNSNSIFDGGGKLCAGEKLKEEREKWHESGVGRRKFCGPLTVCVVVP